MVKGLGSYDVRNCDDGGEVRLKMALIVLGDPGWHGRREYLAVLGGLADKAARRQGTGRRWGPRERERRVEKGGGRTYSAAKRTRKPFSSSEVRGGGAARAPGQSAPETAILPRCSRLGEACAESNNRL